VKLFTFDSRSNITWDLLGNYFNLNDKQMHDEIEANFNNLKVILKKNKINYDELRSVLTPSQDKYEICFVYDSSKTVNETSYGYEILNGLLPDLLECEKLSVFYGDIITDGSRKSNIIVKDVLQQNFPTYDFNNYKMANQYFVVYVNNLTKNALDKIDIVQRKYPSYVGYIDMSFPNLLKDILSTCIGVRFIKIKNKICIPTPEDDLENARGYVCYSFDEKRDSIVGIEDVLFSTFLSFKIQRSFFSFDVNDQILGLIAVYDSSVNLSEFSIILTDKKLKYIKENKNGSLKITGLDELSKVEFVQLIQNRINTNYIFDIELNEHCFKFATTIDVKKENTQRKYIAVFEIIKEKKQLRVISFY